MKVWHYILGGALALLGALSAAGLRLMRALERFVDEIHDDDMYWGGRE